MVSAGNWNRLDQAREQSFYKRRRPKPHARRGSPKNLRAKDCWACWACLRSHPRRRPRSPALQLADVLPELPTTSNPTPMSNLRLAAAPRFAIDAHARR